MSGGAANRPTSFQIDLRPEIQTFQSEEEIASTDADQDKQKEVEVVIETSGNARPLIGID